MRVLIFLLILFVSACTSTELSEPITIPKPNNSNPTLDLSSKSVMYINRFIDDYTVDSIRKKYKKLKYLILNSPGGTIDDAYRVALFVKYGGIITVIPKYGRCDSACTIIFQAGKERHASSTASIMYHGSRVDSKFMDAYFKECPIVNERCLTLFEKMKYRIKRSTINVFKKLEEYGLSHDVFLLLLEQPPQKKWLLKGNLTGYSDLRFTAKESMQYNAVTHIIEYRLVK